MLISRGRTFERGDSLVHTSSCCSSRQQAPQCGTFSVHFNTLNAVPACISQPGNFLQSALQEIMLRYDTFPLVALGGLSATAASSNDKIAVNGAMSKRVYFCQRCLNHGLTEPRKNHKCECAYANCTCEKCILVEKRRVLNTQLHELEEVVDAENEMDSEEQNSDSNSGSRVKGG
ncbi:hypothetical protein L596_028688 [Steinernema carpocapsae]|uniref:DM domain-containing protein n=2 Tax=Steinernema carpocapsae TaxID=34508 RepID=A0A4V5ZXY9_STECR|nr:hypothetical protein L596_028688 [Steinernema carpocapsae]